MGNKINIYIDTLFKDIPKTIEAIELQEELMANLTERYIDYIKEGKNEDEAYNLAIKNIGDIDEILKDVIPTTSTIETNNINTNNVNTPPTNSNENSKNRELKARNNAISMILYMAFPIILIGFSKLFNAEIIGLLLALSCVAIATGLLVYTSTALPTNDNSNIYNSSSSTSYDFIHIDNETKLKLKQIDNIIIGTSTCIYLALGFLFEIWFRSTIIFIIAGILCSIMKTNQQLKTLEASERINKEGLQ